MTRSAWTRSLFLALDTATDTPSVALGAPGEAAATVRLAARRELSREIDRLVEGLLSERHVAVGDLSGVIVADGPGSFTGLRIGIAFAKGLCRARGLPLLAGPSLLGAALTACGGEGTVLAEYDALRGDVYRAVYRFTGRAGAVAPLASGEPATGGVEVLAAPALVARDAPVPAYPTLLRADGGHASAVSLIRLCGFAGGLEPIDAPDRWEPMYGRLAEAEVRRRARER